MEWLEFIVKIRWPVVLLIIYFTFRRTLINSWNEAWKENGKEKSKEKSKEGPA